MDFILDRNDEKVARSNLQEEIERESINAKKTKEYFTFLLFLCLVKS